MNATSSKLTSKYQATIPEAVRKMLHLTAGDSISFVIDKEQVHLRKARSVDLAFAKSIEGTLSEWESEADERAYSDL